MRIVSLVPSWTETLIDAGVEVVGRTRFCIHPQPGIENIPVVGGTKKVDLERIAAVAPDLLVLDREENTREIAEASPVPYFASHVRSVEDVGRDLSALGRRLATPSEEALGDGPARLEGLAERWRNLAALPEPGPRPLSELPGVVDWIRPPGDAHRQFVYLVWRKPWMAVGPETFIGSVFRRLGYGAAHLPSNEPYPEIDLADLDPQTTVLLFATEPFPFDRFPELMTECGFSAALVDGEAYSWFGVRTLRFLERELAR